MRQLKKLFRVTAIIVASILVLLCGIAGYIIAFLPHVGNAPDLKIEQTPERIRRGAYLANHVMACMSCHSTRNWEQPGGPVMAGTLGKGGDKFTQDSLGFFGDLYFPNITPAALHSWTDGEIFRAITTGVDKHGKALTSIMPYELYGKADAEDIKSVIAYLRTLPPVENKMHQNNKLPVLMQIVTNLSPAKPQFQQRPSLKDTVGYGRYLTRIAGCIVCHSPFNGPFEANPEKVFSGGPEFTMPALHVTPINLTPDNETGIGLWSREDFINKFRRYRDSSVTRRRIDPKKDFTSLMPWASFAGMKEEDLSAIYTYLRTLKPVRNKVKHIITREELAQRTRNQ
jgi:mono/diheme cytochrome c family protein